MLGRLDFHHLLAGFEGNLDRPSSSKCGNHPGKLGIDIGREQVGVVELAVRVAHHYDADRYQPQNSWPDLLVLRASVSNARFGEFVNAKFTRNPPLPFTVKICESSGKSPMEIMKIFDLEEWRTSPLKAEHPRHQVQITQPFYLGATEVTQEQYAMVMENEPWSDIMYARAYKGYPATYVRRDQATAFCKRLSEREGRTYRLPTEAEWEYACRAGAHTAYCFGNKLSQLSEYAWFNHNADEVGERYAHKVGWKNANAFGLYDMHGNVWEWCADWYSETYYRDSPVKQPLGPANGVYRINRGGSWGDHASRCRSAVRSGNSPEFSDYFTGFRVALVPSSGIGE